MMRQSKWEKREVQRLKQLQQQLLNLTRAGGEDRKEDADEIHDETSQFTLQQQQHRVHLRCWLLWNIHQLSVLCCGQLL